jgi:hypothetical protein
LPSRRGESGAPEALAEYGTTLLVPGNHVSSQKRNPACYLIQACSRTGIGIGPHAIGGGRESGCELQRFVGRQTRHQEEILLSGVFILPLYRPFGNTLYHPKKARDAGMLQDAVALSVALVTACGRCAMGL